MKVIDHDKIAAAHRLPNGLKNVFFNGQSMTGLDCFDEISGVHESRTCLVAQTAQDRRTTHAGLGLKSDYGSDGNVSEQTVDGKLLNRRQHDFYSLRVLARGGEQFGMH